MREVRSEKREARSEKELSTFNFQHSTPSSALSPQHSALFSLLAFLLLASFAFAKDPQLDQAESLRNKKKPDEAMVLYQAVLARPKLSMDDRLKCQTGIIECLRQLKKYEEALAQAKALYESVPADHWMNRQAAQTICDLLAQLTRLDEAAELAAKVAQAAADEHETASDWRLRCAFFHLRNKKYSEAYEQAGKAAELAKIAEDHRRVIDALWAQSDAMSSAQDWEKCLVPLKQALELKYDDLTPGTLVRFKQRMAECWTKLNRPHELRAAYKSFIAVETDPAQRQRWWLSIAHSWEAEKNLREAIAAYEQVLIDHPESACREHWHEAQANIIRFSLQDADANASLKIQHLAMDLADNKERIQSAAQQMLALLKKVDGNLTRAKAFAAYQQYGRAGPDGKLGTADDLTDPLEAIGYPDNPARVAAFEAASAKLGCDAEASLHRGWMCMHIGRPREAAGWFIDACRRGAGDEYQSAASALVFCAARASTGSIGDVERFADFLLYGPSGADCKSDIPDPFAAIAAPPAMKATALSPADRATLAETQKRLAAGLDLGLWQPDMKLDVIAALERLHGGLADWNAPGLADWYLARIRTDTAPKIPEALFPGALAAARGSQIHLEAVRALLAKLDADGGRPMVRETNRKAWANWMQRLENLSRARTLVPRMVVK